MLKKNMAQEKEAIAKYPGISDTKPPKGSSKSLKPSSENALKVSQRKTQIFEFTIEGRNFSYQLTEDDHGFFTLKDQNGQEIVGKLRADTNQKEQIYQALVQNLKITAENLKILKKIAGLDTTKIFDENGQIIAGANDYLLDVLQSKQLTEEQKTILIDFFNQINNQLRVLEDIAVDIQRRVAILSYAPRLSDQQLQTLNLLNNRYAIISQEKFAKIIGEKAIAKFNNYLYGKYYVIDLNHQSTDLRTIIAKNLTDIKNFELAEQVLREILINKDLLLVDLDLANLQKLSKIDLTILNGVTAAPYGNLTVEEINKLKDFYYENAINRIIQKDIADSASVKQLRQMIKNYSIDQQAEMIGKNTSHHTANMWMTIKNNPLFKNLSAVDNVAMAVTFTLATAASVLNPLVSWAAMAGFGFFALRKLFMSAQGNKTARIMDYVRKSNGGKLVKSVKFEKPAWDTLVKAGLLENKDFNFSNGLSINSENQSVKFSYGINFDKAFLPLLEVISKAKGDLNAEIAATKDNNRVKKLQEQLGAIESLEVIAHYRATVTDLGKWERQYAQEWLLEVDQDFELPQELLASAGVILHDNPEYQKKYGKKILQINYLSTNQEIELLINSQAVRKSFKINQQELIKNYPVFDQSNITNYFDQVDGFLVPKANIYETAKKLLDSETYQKFVDFLNEQSNLVSGINIANKIVHRYFNAQLVNPFGYEGLMAEARASMLVEGTSTFGAPNYTFNKFLVSSTTQLAEMPFLMKMMINSDARSNFNDVVTGQINRVHKYAVQRDITAHVLEDVIVFDQELATGRSFNKKLLALDLVNIDGHIDGGNIAVALAESVAEASPADGFTRFLFANILRGIDLWLNEDGLDGADSLEGIKNSQRSKKIVFEINGKKDAENDKEITLLNILKKRNQYFHEKYQYRLLSDLEIMRFVDIYQRRYQIFQMEQDFCAIADKIQRRLELSIDEKETFQKFLTTKYALTNAQAQVILKSYQENLEKIQLLTLSKIEGRDNTHVYSYINNPSVSSELYEGLLSMGSLMNFLGHRGNNEGYEHYLFNLPTTLNNLEAYFNHLQEIKKISPEQCQDFKKYIREATKTVNGGRGNGGGLELLRRKIEYSLRINFSENNWDRQVTTKQLSTVLDILTGIPGNGQKNIDTVQNKETNSLLAVFGNQLAREIHQTAVEQFSTYQKKMEKIKKLKKIYPKMTSEDISRRIWLEDKQVAISAAKQKIKDFLQKADNQQLLEMVFGEKYLNSPQFESFVADILDSLEEVINLSRLYDESNAEGMKSAYGVSMDEFIRAVSILQQSQNQEELDKIAQSLSAHHLESKENTSERQKKAFQTAVSLLNTMLQLNQKNFAQNARRGFPLSFADFNLQIQNRLKGILDGKPTSHRTKDADTLGDIFIRPFTKQKLQEMEQQGYSGGIENFINYQDVDIKLFDRDNIKLPLNEFLTEQSFLAELLKAGFIRQEGAEDKATYYVATGWQNKVNKDNKATAKKFEKLIQEALTVYQKAFQEAAQHLEAVEKARLDLILIFNGTAGIYNQDVAYNLADSLISEYQNANGKKTLSQIAAELQFNKFYFGNFYDNKYHIIAGKKIGDTFQQSILSAMFNNYSQSVELAALDESLIAESRQIIVDTIFLIDKSPNWIAKGQKPQNFNGMYLGYTVFEQLQKLIKVAFKKYRLSNRNLTLTDIWKEMKDKLMLNAISFKLDKLNYRGVDYPFVEFLDKLIPYIDQKISEGKLVIPLENKDIYDLRNDNKGLIDQVFQQAMQIYIADQNIAQEDRDYALKISRALASKSEYNGSGLQMNIDKDNWIYDFAVSLAAGIWQLDMDGRPHHGSRLVLAQGNQDMSFSKYASLARAAVQDMIDFIHTMSTYEGAMGMHPSTGCGQWRNRIDDVMFDYVRMVYDIQPNDHKFKQLEEKYFWKKFLSKEVGQDGDNVASMLIKASTGLLAASIFAPTTYYIFTTLALTSPLLALGITGGVFLGTFFGVFKLIDSLMIKSIESSTAYDVSENGARVATNRPMTKAELARNLFPNIDWTVMQKGFLMNVAPILFTSSMLWGMQALSTIIFGSYFAFLPLAVSLAIKAGVALFAFSKVNSSLSEAMKKLIQISDRYDFSAKQETLTKKTHAELNKKLNELNKKIKDEKNELELEKLKAEKARIEEQINRASGKHLFALKLPDHFLTKPLVIATPLLLGTFAAAGISAVTGLGLLASGLLMLGFLPVTATFMSYYLATALTWITGKGLNAKFDIPKLYLRLQYSPEDSSVEDFKEGENIYLGDLFSTNFVSPIFSAPAEASPVVVVDVQFPRWNLTHIELIPTELVNAKIAARMHKNTKQYNYLHSLRENQFHHMANDDKYPMISPQNFAFNYPFIFSMATGISIFAFDSLLIGLGIASTMATPVIFGIASLMFGGYRLLMKKIADLHDMQGLNTKFRRAGTFREIIINLVSMESIRMKLYSLAKAPFISSEPIEISQNMHFSDIYKQALLKIAIPIALPTLIASKLAVTVSAMLSGGALFSAGITAMLALYLGYWAVASIIRFVTGPIDDSTRNNLTVSTNSSLLAEKGGVEGRYVTYDGKNEFFRVKKDGDAYLYYQGRAPRYGENTQEYSADNQNKNVFQKIDKDNLDSVVALELTKEIAGKKYTAFLDESLQIRVRCNNQIIEIDQIKNKAEKQAVITLFNEISKNIAVRLQIAEMQYWHNNPQVLTQTKKQIADEVSKIFEVNNWAEFQANLQKLEQQMATEALEKMGVSQYWSQYQAEMKKMEDQADKITDTVSLKKKQAEISEQLSIQKKRLLKYKKEVEKQQQALNALHTKQDVLIEKLTTVLQDYQVELVMVKDEARINLSKNGKKILTQAKLQDITADLFQGTAEQKKNLVRLFKLVLEEGENYQEFSKLAQQVNDLSQELFKLEIVLETINKKIDQ